MDIKEKKVDLRVQKTIHSIKGTFIELVEQRGFKNVSVCQITKKANINRNTFYLHYSDIDELAKQVIEDASKDLVAILISSSSSLANSLENISEVEIRWELRLILRYIEKDVELYRVYLVDERLKSYINNLSDRLKYFLARILKIQNPRSNIVFEYAYSGMFGIITQWILYSTTSPDETAKVLSILTYDAIQYLKTIK